jgi:hypothetical protein
VAGVTSAGRAEANFYAALETSDMAA